MNRVKYGIIVRNNKDNIIIIVWNLRKEEYASSIRSMETARKAIAVSLNMWRPGKGHDPQIGEVQGQSRSLCPIASLVETTEVVEVVAVADAAVDTYHRANHLKQAAEEINLESPTTIPTKSLLVAYSSAVNAPD